MLLSSTQDETLQEVEELEITCKEMLKNLKFEYKKPVVVKLKVNTLIKELKVKSNARFIEIYDAGEYKITITNEARDLCISSGIWLKFFLKKSLNVLEIQEILVNGKDVSEILKESLDTTNTIHNQTKILSLETLSDQLHLLEVKMDYKLSKIQSLLEQLLKK
jgi:hypothetical protein